MRYRASVLPQVIKEDKTKLENLERYSTSSINQMADFIYSMPLYEENFDKLNIWLREAFFSVNLGQGMPLSEREKLIPIFTALEERFSTGETPNVLYRGFRIPASMKHFLTKLILKTNYCDVFNLKNNLAKHIKLSEGITDNEELTSRIQELYYYGGIEIPKSFYSKEESKIASFAYGLRSWTDDKDYANLFNVPVNDQEEGVLFIMKNPKKHIFHTNKYLYILKQLKINQNSKIPFDFAEFVVFLQMSEIKIDKIVLSGKGGYDASCMYNIYLS